MLSRIVAYVVFSCSFWEVDIVLQERQIFDQGSGLKLATLADPPHIILQRKPICRKSLFGNSSAPETKAGPVLKLVGNARVAASIRSLRKEKATKVADTLFMYLP